jgi:maltokinase
VDDATFGAWVQGQRWYFEKGQPLTGVATVWRHRILDDEGDVDLTIMAATFASGQTSYYFVPVAVQSGGEASDHPVFKRWLIASLNDDSLTPNDLNWVRIGTGIPAGATELPGHVLGVEQSNTSIRYDNQFMVKVNRRLTVGPSPEAELLPVISRAADRSFAPEGFGTLWQTTALAAPTCLAVCTQYVPNLGDGWSYFQSLAAADRNSCIAEATAIGNVTARMHMGLISDPWRAEVSPEPIRASDTARWTSSALSQLDRLVGETSQRIESFDVESRALAELLPAVVPTLRERLAGFSALAGTSQIRIHGDYHLGQVLRQESGGYVVVDFDGEPNRAIGERRAKYSALRDVAGMTRSFAYLRGTLERQDTESSRAEWLEWEEALRSAFLDEYLATLNAGDLILIPPAPADVETALTALELEKAIYECIYEMATRPDWLPLPLSRLVRAR